jgi:hypothetical protein
LPMCELPNQLLPQIQQLLDRQGLLVPITSDLTKPTVSEQIG